MKKALITLLAITSLIACKPSKKTEPKAIAPVTGTEKSYQLNTETVVVNWIGYKFTEKKGVKGKFKTINIKNTTEANTMEKALSNVVFSIPVSSLFSNNEIRDNKLKKLFFGVMDNTELITGKVLKITPDAGGVIALTLNNETHDLPFKLERQGNKGYLKATLDLKVWHAEKAVASIHKACKLLHTGADGVSKTWDTVDIDVVFTF